MASATLTSKGQITIPRQVRERLQLSQGDRVTFSVQPTGEIVLRRAVETDDEALAGILQHLGKRRTVSVLEMNRAVRRRTRLADRRSRSVKR